MAIAVTAKFLLGVNSASGGTVSSLASDANQLMLIAVWNRVTSGTAALPTISGTARTWTQIATQLSGDNFKRVTLFRSLQSGAVTEDAVIDCGATQTHIRYAGTGFAGINTGGTNGSSAIVQSLGGTNSGAQTGITITLSAFASTENAAYGYVAKDGSNNITEGSGFTMLGEDTGYPTVHHEYKANDATVDWSWSSESTYTVAIACEVAIAPTSIKKFMSISQANLKKVIGVTNANIKKLAGVANS